MSHEVILGLEASICSFIADSLLVFILLLNLYYSKVTKFFNLAIKKFSTFLEYNKGEFPVMVPRLFHS